MNYFLWIDEKQAGPYDQQQIRDMIKAGEITALTLGHAADGSGEWSQIGSLFNIFPSSAAKPTPPSLETFSNLTIGDIAITSDKVITPNGIGTLADSQWIFSDLSRTESKIPPVAVILAIVFALLCLIGLLFLLMKETTTTGYAEVSVHSGNLYHKVQIPVKSKADVDRIRELVNKAQSLAAQARANK
jgi:hypothetical protein